MDLAFIQSLLPPSPEFGTGGALYHPWSPQDYLLEREPAVERVLAAPGGPPPSDTYLLDRVRDPSRIINQGQVAPRPVSVTPLAARTPVQNIGDLGMWIPYDASCYLPREAGGDGPRRALLTGFLASGGTRVPCPRCRKAGQNSGLRLRAAKPGAMG